MAASSCRGLYPGKLRRRARKLITVALWILVFAVAFAV
jgi:hypothetical protein